ncbi:MAG: DUF2520 domain-containing protein [Bacteroidales bacterium]
MSRIVLIGAGNVATHLGIALSKSGNEIVQVYSRTDNSAIALARKLDTEFTTSLSSINRNADLFLLTVSDDALSNVLKDLNVGNNLLVHTSGFLSMDALARNSENYGVFYPLQTFSKSRSVEMRTMPVCIEANSEKSLGILKSLARQISDDVRNVNSEQRRKLHLAAVFACNFANYMYSVAAQILEDSGIDFDILKPLIAETAAKIQDMIPLEAQTGPAIRGDKSIMDAHLKMLEQYPEFRAIYKLISTEIEESHRHFAVGKRTKH